MAYNRNNNIDDFSDRVPERRTQASRPIQDQSIVSRNFGQNSGQNFEQNSRQNYTLAFNQNASQNSIQNAAPSYSFKPLYNPSEIIDLTQPFCNEPNIKISHWQNSRQKVVKRQPTPEEYCDMFHFVQTGRKSDLEQLIIQNIDVNFKNSEKATPLSYACLLQECEIAGLLLLHGADPNHCWGLHNSSELHNAVATNNLTMVDLLIISGANVNGLDNYNRTPIYLAISAQNIDMCQHLIQSGANLKIRSTTNYTPLELAQTLKNNEIVNLINIANDTYPRNIRSNFHGIDIEQYYQNWINNKNKQF